MYLHSVQAKQRMLITVVSGTMEKTSKAKARHHLVTVEPTQSWCIQDGSQIGKSQPFRNVWGDIRSLPLARVQLAVGGKKYSLEVVVTGSSSDKGPSV